MGGLSLVLIVLGEYVLFFLLLYGYEKAIQKHDPVLRKPWEWPVELPKVIKPRRHLRVVK